LPFAKTVFIEVTDPVFSPYVLPDFWKLEASVNSYFGVLMTNRPMPPADEMAANHEKLTIAYDGILEVEIEGYFAAVDITIDGFLDGVPTNVTTSVDFFLAFDCTNITDMQGYLPLVYSQGKAIGKEVRETDLLHKMKE
jgi:hypothetical protein